jgi:hypothetical protein
VSAQEEKAILGPVGIGVRALAPVGDRLGSGIRRVRLDPPQGGVLSACVPLDPVVDVAVVGQVGAPAGRQDGSTAVNWEPSRLTVHNPSESPSAFRHTNARRSPRGLHAGRVVYLHFSGSAGRSSKSRSSEPSTRARCGVLGALGFHGPVR